MNHCPNHRSRYWSAATAVLLLVLLAAPADGHPHVFIDVSAKFILSDSGVAGITMIWDFDEMNSAMMVSDFDTNKNNRFDKEEIAHIVKTTLPYIGEQNFYTVLRWGKNRTLRIRTVERFNAIIRPDGTVRYSFYIPCNLSRYEIGENGLTMLCIDPSIFIAFELNRDMIQAGGDTTLVPSISFGRHDYAETVTLRLEAGL